jgi:hypothetical protein
VSLTPKNKRHRLQIEAGTIGRKRGHQFEKDLAEAISAISLKEVDLRKHVNANRVLGNPALEITKYIAKNLGLSRVDRADAWWLGGLATSGLGDILHTSGGERIRRSKTDVLVSLREGERKYVRGVSVKTCSKNTPTNDQLFFTTASAFSELLRSHQIRFSKEAEKALKMFCGDVGYRPMDLNAVSQQSRNPERWFFEELPEKGRRDIENALNRYQAQISRILLQLAYSEDPHPPEYLLHLTVKPADVDEASLALFTIDELIAFSCRYTGFHTKEYLVRKGRFRGDRSVHLAPRFGFVQFQRGGQVQHPTQLQFNLQAGYFNHLISGSS